MQNTDVSATSVTRALEHIRRAVRDEKAYRVGLPEDIVVKLNQNESPFDLPDELKEELLGAMQEVPFNRYPADQPVELQRALAKYTGHPAEGILVGNGSNELTHTLGLALIEAGKPVVLPRPMFSLYESVARLHDGEVIGVPPRADLSFDAEQICAEVEAKSPSLTVLTTPNNPTGLAMPLAEIEMVVDAAEGFVLIDEAYVEFHPRGNGQALLDSHPNVLLMRTFSKAFGLAGLRVGYLLGHPDVIAELMKARLPFMIGRFAELAARTILKHTDLIEARVQRMRESVQELAAGLSAMDGVSTLPTHANFVIFKPGVEPSDVMRRLAKAGVLIRNMGGYPELQGYLRVNAGTPIENKAFLAALEAALSDRG